jgi:cell division protein FtsQ
MQGDENSSRRKKSHSGNSMYYSVILLIVIVTFVILSTTVFFKVNTVTVTGSSIYTAEEIIAASGIKGGDNLIRTKTGKCESLIEQQLIYVEEAEITRSFPSTLVINIIPCKEKISAEYEEGFCLLSESGKILKQSDEPFPDTTIIYGARLREEDDVWEEDTSGSVTSAVSSAAQTDSSEDEESADSNYPVLGDKFACAESYRTEVFYSLTEVADTALDGKIDSFDMSDYLNVSCIYDNRITIELGAAAELDYKFKLANTIISTKIGPLTEGTLTMLSGGASFIDKAGLEQNELNYQSNISGSGEDTADTSVTEEADGEETSSEVDFE